MTAYLAGGPGYGFYGWWADRNRWFRYGATILFCGAAAGTPTALLYLAAWTIMRRIMGEG